MNAMERAAWLERRRVTGFGGSDAAAALGLSKFKSRLQLYLEKRGEIPQSEDTEFFHWRREMEDPILREYSKRAGHVVVRPTDIVVSQKYPWMFTTYDGIVLDAASSRRANRVVQAKTALSKKDGWGEPGSDDVPDDYYIQVQHEMLVADAPVADIPVLFFFNKLEIYTVEANREVQESIVDQEHRLWQMIQSGEPPAVESVEDAKLKWGRTSKLGRVIATGPVADAVKDMHRIDDEIAKLQVERADAELVVMEALKEDEALCTHDGELLLTWKAQAGNRTVDSAKLQKMYPQAYADCVKQGKPFRKMLLK